jgi:hypothetical protein
MYTVPGGQVTAFAGNGGYLFAGIWGGGVFRTTDNGVSWTALNSGLTKKDVLALGVYNNNIFVGTDSGVFASTNNGATWTEAGLVNIWVDAFAVSGSRLFAGTYHGIYYTDDNGATWGEPSVTWYSTFGFAVSGGIIFAATGCDMGFGGVYRSTDNGTTWTQIGPQYYAVYAILVYGTTIFAGINPGIFRSTDSGANWTYVNQGVTISTNNFAISGTNIFAGGLVSGVFLSANNGDSWTAVNTGLTQLDIFGLAAYDGYLFAGTDSGTIWRRPLSEFSEVQYSKPPAQWQFYNFRFENNTFRYTLAEPEYVALKVYDYKGRLHSELVNRHQAAGTYCVSLANRPSAAGTYLAVFKAGEFCERKPVFVAK